MISLNDVQAQALLDRGTGIYAIVFTAADSYPCKLFAAEVAIVERELQRLVRFWRVEVVENPAAAACAGVDAVPVTSLYDNGVLIEKWEGPYAAEALVRRMSTAVAWCRHRKAGGGGA